MTAALTFDVDWAPEWAIEVALDACAGQPATFFVTHRSPALASPALVDSGSIANSAGAIL